MCYNISIFKIWLIFITIPKTVIGISAPYFETAPYFPNKLFWTDIKITKLISVIKLLIPKEASLPITFVSNFIISLVKLIDLNFLTYKIFNIKVKRRKNCIFGYIL